MLKEEAMSEKAEMLAEIHEFREKIKALEDERGKLEKLVRTAYTEGADDWTDQWCKGEGKRASIIKALHDSWLESDTRKILAEEIKTTPAGRRIRGPVETRHMDFPCPEEKETV